MLGSECQPWAMCLHSLFSLIKKGQRLLKIFYYSCCNADGGNSGKLNIFDTDVKAQLLPRTMLMRKMIIVVTVMKMMKIEDVGGGGWSDNDDYEDDDDKNDVCDNHANDGDERDRANEDCGGGCCPLQPQHVLGDVPFSISHSSLSLHL